MKRLLVWAKKIDGILFLWTICGIFNIITFLYIFYKLRPYGKTLALHYNVVVGVDWFGKGQNLYFLPFSGLVINALNFTLYRFFKGTRFFYGFLLAFASFCAQLVLLFSGVLLARVN